MCEEYEAFHDRTEKPVVGGKSSSSFVPNVIKTNTLLNDDLAHQELLLQRYGERIEITIRQIEQILDGCENPEFCWNRTVFNDERLCRILTIHRCSGLSWVHSAKRRRSITTKRMDLANHKKWARIGSCDLFFARQKWKYSAFSCVLVWTVWYHRNSVVLILLFLRIFYSWILIEVIWLCFHICFQTVFPVPLVRSTLQYVLRFSPFCAHLQPTHDPRQWLIFNGSRKSFPRHSASSSHCSIRPPRATVISAHQAEVQRPILKQENIQSPIMKCRRS